MHLDFKKLIMITPIVFLYSTINTQRQAHDLSGYCTVVDELKANFVEITHFTQAESKSEGEVIMHHGDVALPVEHEATEESVVYLNEVKTRH